MKRVAVLGKPANGKSTLSRQLALVTGIKLYAVDSILYKANGEEVNRKYYEEAHEGILSLDEWIIEGFGPMNSMDSFNSRLEVADTVIYIDLPYSVTYWLVAKRFFKGLFIKPEGWPEGCSILKGTLESYKILKLCPKFWNDAFLDGLEKRTEGKALYVIRSVSELNRFIKDNVERFQPPYGVGIDGQ